MFGYNLFWNWRNTGSIFVPPGNGRCRAGLDTFSPQAACSTVSRAAGSQKPTVHIHARAPLLIMQKL